MIVDSYGRDLDWLRANRPARPPSRLARLVHVIWPLSSVAAWNDWQRLERESGDLASSTTGGALDELIAWLEHQVEHGHAPDGMAIDMYPLYADGRRSAHLGTLAKVKRLRDQLP